MTFIRSRLALTLIGLVIIGGVSAALAAMTAPHPFQTALIGAGQTSATHSAAIATATAAPPSNSAPAAPTNPPQPAPTARATTPPATGQNVDLHGVVASVNTSAETFSMTTSNGSSVTVVVTAATSFQGDAHSLSALRSGWKVEVQGTMQADGSVLASDVNADSGN